MENKDFDLMCYDFTQNIIKIINESGLPITAVHGLLKDIFKEVEETKQNKILSMLQAEQPIEEKTMEIPVTIDKEESEEK